jgi:hypothetical protein
VGFLLRLREEVLGKEGWQGPQVQTMLDVSNTSKYLNTHTR